VYSWQLWNLKDFSRKCCSCLYDCIGTGSPPPAGGLKAAGIYDQCLTIPAADGPVRMAINHAVDIGKEVPKACFDIVAKSGPMGQADGKISQAEGCFPWQHLPGCTSTHVAADGMDGFVGKGIKNADIGQISGVNDYFAVGKTMVDQLLKQVIGSRYMGIGKNTGFNCHGSMANI
jgi:hypothetical protein